MHHIILLDRPIVNSETATDSCLLNVTDVKILPNGLAANKANILQDAYPQIIYTNNILFASPCKNIRPNNIYFRMVDKGNNCYMISGTLLQTKEWLLSDNFMQIHDSYIINKNHVVSISPHYEIYLKGFENPLPIGRFYSNRVDSILLPQKPFLHLRSHHKKCREEGDRI